MRDVRLEGNAAQVAAWSRRDVGEFILQGGAGSGKTHCGARWAILRRLENPGRVDHLVVAPTYKFLIAPIVPSLEEACDQFGIKGKHLKQQSAFVFVHRRVRHRILLRSAEIPDNLAGPNIGCVWFDEGALCEKRAYERIVQRLRHPHAKIRQLLVTTTPEGTRTWVQERIKKADAGHPQIAYAIARTRDNPAGTEDWFARMEEFYGDSEAGYRQYMDGIATDAAGTVYTAFTSKNEVPCKEVRDGQIVVGWDFNRKWMHTVVGTWNEYRSTLHIWGEVVSRRLEGITTDEHAKEVVKYLRAKAQVELISASGPGGQLELRDQRGQHVIAWLDPASRSPHTSSTKTDFTHVHNAGFSVRARDSHMLVRDRVATVQHAFRQMRLLVDKVGAPITYRSLKEQDRGKNGEPRKDYAADEFQCDHGCDSSGYLVCGILPVALGRPRAGSIRPESDF